jgi:CelD/BcsL family acetyltransferase involved in cellulose biosynthesis
VHVQDCADIARTMDTLISQKERSLARMGVENIFARPGYREFVLDVAADPGMRELVHVGRMDVGSTMAATSLGLTFRGCYYLFFSSYQDGALARLGPGRAHLHELIRHAIDRGFDRFDFTIGDEAYKREWSDIELKLYDHLAANTVRGWAAVAMIVAFRRTKRFIKQTPPLWRAFSKARAIAGRLSRRPGG